MLRMVIRFFAFNIKSEMSLLLDVCTISGQATNPETCYYEATVGITAPLSLSLFFFSAKSYWLRLPSGLALILSYERWRPALPVLELGLIPLCMTARTEAACCCETHNDPWILLSSKCRIAPLKRNDTRCRGDQSVLMTHSAEETKAFWWPETGTTVLLQGWSCWPLSWGKWSIAHFFPSLLNGVTVLLFPVENMLCFHSSEAMKHTSLIPNLLWSIGKTICPSHEAIMHKMQLNGTLLLRQNGQFSSCQDCAPHQHQPHIRQVRLHLRVKNTGGEQLAITHVPVGCRHMEERLASRQYLQLFYKLMTDWSSNLNAMRCTYSRMLHQSKGRERFPSAKVQVQVKHGGKLLDWDREGVCSFSKWSFFLAEQKVGKEVDLQQNDLILWDCCIS